MMSLRRGGVGPNNDNRGFSWPPTEEEKPIVRRRETLSKEYMIPVAHHYAIFLSCLEFETY